MTTTVPHTLDQIAASIQGYDPKALPIPSAKAFIARLVQPVTTIETVGIRDALGRVLARDVVSPLDVPPHDNSAMDGFALRSADLVAGGDTRLRIVGTGLAGQPYTGSVPAGHALRITTGAVMPAGLDTVVPQEFTRVETDASGEYVVFTSRVVQPGDNRRLRGEDLAAGKAAVQAGVVLRPAELGLVASLGIGEVAVFRRLRVAYFSTGDEIHSIGDALSPGGVFDSNRYTVHGMLQRMGIDVIDMGVVRDDPAALEAAFTQAASKADAVITSGGVSVGEADHTKRIMARLGDVVFWRIAMRPGRPMAIGRIRGAASGDTAGDDRRDAILFGLPGNPVAVMVTFYAMVRDALLAMSGATARPTPVLRAACTTAVRKKPGRTEYQRGIVRQRADGSLEVEITGNQGSGVLSSMSIANGLIVLGHDSGNVAVGDTVDVWPFEGLV
jgi:molybdopterin molybdotransferase